MARDGSSCYRHPDRATGVACQRCGKAICPSCMHQASVGFHCPDCVKAGGQRVHTARSLSATRPALTFGLIAVNILAWLANIGSGATAGDPRGGDLFIDWALFGPSIKINDEWYRLLSSGFMHASLFHIAFNMYLLYMLGQQLEKVLGTYDFAMVYFAGLAGGSALAVLLDGTTPAVGASGAVFGLMGGWIMFARSRGVDFMNSGIAGLVIINLLLTFSIRSISIGGHVGGLAAGLVAGWIVTMGHQAIPDRRARMGLSAALVLGLFVAGVMIANAQTYV